jgi:hypothetical protein
MVVGSTGHFQLKGIEIPSDLGTAFTKTKLIIVGPGMFPGLFISSVVSKRFVFETTSHDPAEHLLYIVCQIMLHSHIKS